MYFGAGVNEVDSDPFDHPDDGDEGNEGNEGDEGIGDPDAHPNNGDEGNEGNEGDEGNEGAQGTCFEYSKKWTLLDTEFLSPDFLI